MDIGRDNADESENNRPGSNDSHAPNVGPAVAHAVIVGVSASADYGPFGPFRQG
jgi:hypothetical protein